MTVKKFLYITIFILLAIFAIQNIALISVSFLFWEFTLPRSLMLGITFAIGFLIGFGVFEIRQHHNSAKS